MLCSAFTCKAKSWDQGLVCPPSPLLPQHILLFISADMEKSSERASAVWSFQTTNGKHKDLFSLGVSAVGEFLWSWPAKPRRAGTPKCGLCHQPCQMEGSAGCSGEWKELWATAAWVCILRGACYFFCLGTCLGCCSSVTGTHRSWMKLPQFLSLGIGFSFSSQHNK